LDVKAVGMQAAVNILKAQLDEMHERRFMVKKFALMDSIEKDAGELGMQLLEKYRMEGRPKQDGLFPSGL
jgi:hypothetical protein